MPPRKGTTRATQATVPATAPETDVSTATTTAHVTASESCACSNEDMRAPVTEAFQTVQSELYSYWQLSDSLSVGHEIAMAEEYLAKARNAWCDRTDKEAIAHMCTVAAVCIRAMATYTVLNAPKP